MDDVTPRRKTYHVAIVKRPDDGTPVGQELKCKVMEGNIRAVGPISARRGVLEQTWSEGWLVSRFLSVECLD